MPRAALETIRYHGAMTLDPALGALIVGCIAILLAGAGTHKLRNLRQFDEIFAAYGLIPGLVRLRLSRLLPFLEIGLAVGMLIGAVRLYAGVGVIVLVLTYAAAILINLRRGHRNIACGCGGFDDRRPIAAWMVWRNVLVSLAAGAGVLPWSARPLSPVDAVTIVFGLITISLLYLCVDVLLGDVVRRAAKLRGAP